MGRGGSPSFSYNRRSPVASPQSTPKNLKMNHSRMSNLSSTHRPDSIRSSCSDYQNPFAASSPSFRDSYGSQSGYWQINIYRDGLNVDPLRDLEFVGLVELVNSFKSCDNKKLPWIERKFIKSEFCKVMWWLMEKFDASELCPANLKKVF
eukprot:TRINITY_DN390_c0_g1_i2.p2 TRINITY_DN390_c0_g1~~TRINITY_DN390_c0_g1_i2.p2  ORF type:complete len:150 (-),score=13.87 TRINITY_DN390_c0_g1_i2:68-517(-)